MFPPVRANRWGWYLETALATSVDTVVLAANAHRRAVLIGQGNFGFNGQIAFGQPTSKLSMLLPTTARPIYLDYTHFGDLVSRDIHVIGNVFGVKIAALVGEERQYRKGPEHMPKEHRVRYGSYLEIPVTNGADTLVLAANPHRRSIIIGSNTSGTAVRVAFGTTSSSNSMALPTDASPLYLDYTQFGDLVSREIRAFGTAAALSLAILVGEEAGV